MVYLTKKDPLVLIHLSVLFSVNISQDKICLLILSNYTIWSERQKKAAASHYYLPCFLGLLPYSIVCQQILHFPILNWHHPLFRHNHLQEKLLPCNPGNGLVHMNIVNKLPSIVVSFLPCFLFRKLDRICTKNILLIFILTTL